MKFYTLYYVEDAQKLDSAQAIVDYNTRKNIYVGCCKNLLKSLNNNLTIITNNKTELSKYFPEKNLIQIDFSLELPKDIKFYFAHFKLDVIKWFSKNAKEYSILLDNDVICVGKIPEALEYCIRNEIPSYYDVTSQMIPDIGSSRMVSDKELVMKRDSIGLWAGGEYIGGTAPFFKTLTNEIDSLKELYFTHYKNLFHQGDEFLLSCAIENLLLSKKHPIIFDIGIYGVLERYWSVPTQHVQRDIAAYKQTYLLHLPIDKEFLSTYTDSYNTFFEVYRGYTFRRDNKFLRGVRKLVRILTGKRLKI